MFSPIIMPDEAYKELHENFAYLLPIPKSSSIEGKDDLHYISLEEAVKQPFTDKHQPSLILRWRINNVANGEPGTSLSGNEKARQRSRILKIFERKESISVEWFRAKIA